MNNLGINLRLYIIKSAVIMKDESEWVGGAKIFFSSLFSCCNMFRIYNLL